MAQCDASAPVALHKFRYCALPLASVTSVVAAEDGVLPVKLFRFALPEGQRSGLATGHHLVVGAEIGGHLVTRKYTPVSAPSQTGWIDLLVKIYPSGVMSRHIDSLAPGDTLDVKGPAGYFRYPSGGLPGIGHLAMVAGGTGITPMVGVLRELVMNTDDSTQATLLFANKTEKDILFRDELSQLGLDRRVRVVHTLTGGAEEDGWAGLRGRPTVAMMREVLPPPADGVKVLLCGSKDMNIALKKAALELGHGELSLVIF